jgi:DNA-binding response OmpR family regulator
MKVLIIDDDPQIRDIFAQFVEMLGHEADVAVDGREGLALFDPLVHQAVITDFIMPGLTGLQVAEAIRARSCTTPIVMISGSAAPQDERRAGQAGLRFLPKPISFAQFAATMAEIVEYSGAAQ